MESLAGVGWVGAVGIGSVLYVARKPIFNTISSVSNILLPEVHTKDEAAYLELYSLAVEDGNISEKERTMLHMQARVYGLTEKRIEHLENWFHDNKSTQINELNSAGNQNGSKPFSAENEFSEE